MNGPNAIVTAYAGADESPTVGMVRMVRVNDNADVGEARRQGQALAEQLGFDETPAGQLALAITEAGVNIVKHARDGSMLLRAVQSADATGIEVLALDRGAGMPSVPQSLHDGYSTAGTRGNGLGAIMRSTEGLEIYAPAGSGTALRFEVWSRPVSGGARRVMRVGAICVPKTGEVACGDSWVLVQNGRRRTLLVVDGLGHGPEAATAARVAVELIQQQGQRGSPQQLMALLHEGMRGTRGAAGAVAVLDSEHASGSFCGIGNIGCVIHDGTRTRSLVSHSGILGHQCRKLQAFDFSFPAAALLVAHSDGVGTRWRLDAYPGLAQAHPALIAGILFRDHERRRDDATVVVVRNEAEGEA